MPDHPVAKFVFGLLFDAGSEAAFVVQRSDRAVVCVNPRFEDLVGRRADELVGQTVSAMMVSEIDYRGDDIVDHAGHYEDVALRKLDGYPLYVELTIAHVEHPGLGALAACLARDTTERRSLERELIAKHSALYAAHAELELMVCELRAAQATLEERNRDIAVLAGQVARVGWRSAIGELAAGIAHHLNNPVAALSSTLRTLGNRLAAERELTARTELEQLMQRARGATGRIEEHVAAVVRLHRTGALDGAPRWLDLSRELDTALAMFTGRMGAIAVRRDYGTQLQAHVPQGSLHHVLGNVIANAVTAMPSGGVLDIGVDRRGDSWVIAVGDSGGGVPPEVATSLVDPLVAARGAGAGIGLATAQRLARLWGGDLVCNRRDVGACFEITVPANERRYAPVVREFR